MIWARFVVGVACASMLAVGCGGGSTTPTTTTPPPTLSSVIVSGATSVSAGASTALVATARFSDGSSQVVTTTSTWASSSAGVATVSAAGVVTGVAAGTANITATFQSMSSAAYPVQVIAVAPSVKADFTVTPTNAADGNPGSCPVIPQTPAGFNRLDCKFDSAPSTPPGGITSYRWEILSGSSNVFTTATVDRQSIKCGDLNTTTAGATRDVRLTITTPSGTDTVVKQVTFVKSNPC